MQAAYVPIPLAFNASMIGPVLAQFGTEEQKKEFLPKTANLDIWWSQGFSEPDAGSDLASLRCSAVRDGDDFVVNGQKTWTTLGQYGDWIFNLVRTDPDVKKQAGISMLLIDMTTPGVEVRPIELIDGGHEVNEVWFEDVRVPAENLVGDLNGGWTIAKFLLGNERVGVAPVGATKRVLARAKELAGDRIVRPAAAGARRRPRERADGARAHRAARRGALPGRRAAPGELGAEAQGHRAPAGGQRARARPRRPRRHGVRRRPRRRERGVVARAVAAPLGAGLPQPPQGLDLRRLQRGAAPDHRRTILGL